MRIPSSLLSLLALGAACHCSPTNRPVPDAGGSVQEPVRRVAHIIREYPHATNAFTQGLVFHQGHLFESTGHQGTLRQLSLESAQPVWMERLGNIFAEGLASDGERLYQLTWTEGLLFTWSGMPPQRERTTRYSGRAGASATGTGSWCAAMAAPCSPSTSPTASPWWARCR